MAKYIVKASGDKELFSAQKFERSLRRAGADKALIKQLTAKVLKQPDLNTTKKIYSYAYKKLKRDYPPIAARYNLKSAIVDLGPTGFPFEYFVAEIFRAKGYTAHVDQVLTGKCVDHEVDIVLEKDNKHFMVECKFHKGRMKSDVKTPLYIKARFDDVTQAQGSKNNKHKLDQAIVVTNTKFTSVADRYGTCAGMQMISWSRPKGATLARMIDEEGLHPITALTSLTNKQKKELIDRGLILCKDIKTNTKLLHAARLSTTKIEQVMNEATSICELGAID
ncbi:restriction endonuclease [Candidatus Babeliales bacterium]|nr:restriction endonuclease [Candidatus Babeliales bacterium]